MHPPNLGRLELQALRSEASVDVYVENGVPIGDADIRS